MFTSIPIRHGKNTYYQTETSNCQASFLVLIHQSHVGFAWSFVFSSPKVKR